MRCYMDKVYTCDSVNENKNIEDIFTENKNVKLKVPNVYYKIEYDVTSKNRVTDTIIITLEHEESYIIIPAIKDDSVLDNYGLNAGYAYFILHFISDELIDLGGIERDTYETYYFQPDDFVTNKNGKPRILPAPIVALYAPNLFTKGLRELGYEVDYMVNCVGQDKCFLEYEPDFDLDLNGNTTEVCRARTIEFMIYALKHYDIMHLHSNCSLLLGADRLWSRNSDMKYLVKMGKKIISSYWGMCDITLKGEYDSYKWHSECNVCKKLRPNFCENDKYNSVIKVTRQCADRLLTNGRGVVTDKRTIWVDNPIEIDKYNPDIKNNIPEEFKLTQTDKLRIYHSFGNMEIREDVKGSLFVKEAVKRLQDEGYLVELMFFHKEDHKNLKYYQIQADIVVDQLYAGWYGSTGVECLALGIPVITYINPDVETYIKEELERDIPVVSAMPHTIYEVLKELVSNHQKRQELQKRARKYAEKYHDYRVVAEQLGRIYDDVWKG